MGEYLSKLQIRATEKLLKARKASRRVDRLIKLLDIAKIREGVAWSEYHSASSDAEREVIRSANARVEETK